MSASPVRDADEILVGFTRALRASGVPVTQDRTHGYLAAVALVGLGNPRAVYDAGRATLCASPDDLVRYDQVHQAYFNGRDGLPRARQAQAGVPSFSGLPLNEDGLTAADDADAEVARAMASDVEVLRHRDIGELTAAEKHRLTALFASLRPQHPVRRTPRHEAWHRGSVDASRTLRASLRRMGEPAEIRWRRGGPPPPPGGGGV
jgi:uncharacterized protein with von Willebrand factor type A (vWA) domain